MFELTLENIVPYLRDRGFANVGGYVAELAGGVSNVVFRVETEERVFGPEAIASPARTATPWFSDLSRIYREIDVMQALCGPTSARSCRRCCSATMTTMPSR